MVNVLPCCLYRLIRQLSVADRKWNFSLCLSWNWNVGKIQNPIWECARISERMAIYWWLKLTKKVSAYHNRRISLLPPPRVNGWVRVRAIIDRNLTAPLTMRRISINKKNNNIMTQHTTKRKIKFMMPLFSSDARAFVYRLSSLCNTTSTLFMLQTINSIFEL